MQFEEPEDAGFASVSNEMIFVEFWFNFLADNSR